MYRQPFFSLRFRANYRLWLFLIFLLPLIQVGGAYAQEPPPCTAPPIPGGGVIAFHSDRDGDFEIYVMNGSECNLQQLTHNTIPEAYPAWSPDGSEIVFSEEAAFDIYKMKADGTNRTYLTHSGTGGNPAWSPDGTRIAYQGGTGNAEIFVINTDGTNRQQLTSTPGLDNHAPAWSPDGSLIAYSARRTLGIWLMNPDGSNQHGLTSSLDAYPAWSPDGTRIVFQSGRDGNDEIYVMDADGSGQARLTHNNALDTKPEWSPDGSYIVFESERDGNPEIYVMNADGGNQTRLTNNGTVDGSPTWHVAPNQPPTVDPGGPYSVGEGGAVQVTATGSDPENGPLSYAWDLDHDNTYETPGQSVTFSASGLDGPGSHTIAVQVTDEGSLSATDTAVINVLNVPPMAVFSSTSAAIDEGSTVNVSFSNQFDPSPADTAAGFRYSYDCSSDGIFELANSTADSLTCDYNDDGNYTVMGRIADKDGGYNDYTATILVNNVAPGVGAITAPVDPVQVNTEISASADFSDPGVVDSHTAIWNWGDGSTTAGTINEADGSGTATGSHTYTTAGVYTISVTVTDDDGDSGQSILQFVVVFDPNGGFVTGGGWIDSPAGAYLPDPTLNGKASFGFVCKYQHGATVPTGNTEFQFKVGNLNFHSDTYEWLVVNQGGTRAQFKGAGTINGASAPVGEYRFMIWASDNSPDTFRIKIWWEDTAGAEHLVYDNGADQAVGGGSIVIHQN
ncbi:MAG: PKD domain-containing protein [Chloroflexi bacterium]|nr:PKD domain-containing protein [Chloroflexota bacterium]